jgi:hypothetical protein
LGTYVYADSFLAPSNGLPTVLGTWLSDQGNPVTFPVRFEIWSATGGGGPDPTSVLATTGSIGPFTTAGSLNFFSAPVTGTFGTLSSGTRYFFVITAVGESGGGQYQVGGHTQNSVYQDNGTFWYSNDPAGVNFDGQNLTPEMAFSVTIGTGQNVHAAPALSFPSLAITAGMLWLFAIRRLRVTP